MAAAMPLIAPLRAALALGAAVAAAGLSAPTPATAAALVVARAPGVGSAEHAELLGDAGVRHDRDLPLAGVERVQVTDGTAGEAPAQRRPLPPGGRAGGRPPGPPPGAAPPPRAPRALPPPR